MKAEVLKRLINKYRSGKASAAERYIIDSWYDSFDQDHTSWPDQNKLQDIESRIITKTLSRPKIIHWYRSPLVKVAASILLIISVSLSIHFFRASHKPDDNSPAPTEFKTGNMQIKRIRLSDSTEVILNANSSLTVLPDYGKLQRRVKLTGEAFFKVHKDKLRPYIVNTSELDVKVLGTSFNVQSYTKLKHIKISVTTGKVGISSRERQLALLVPGQQLIFDKQTGEAVKKEANTETSPLWESGITVLDGAGFDELAQSYYNTYGIRISSKDTAVLKNKYNLTIRSTRTYQQTLEQLCTMIGKKYRKEENGGIMIY